MKTAEELEVDIGLGPKSITVFTDANGRTVTKLSGGGVIETECSLWALRCVVRRRGLDAAIDAGIAALGVNQQAAAWAQWNFDGGKLSRSDVLVRQVKGWVGYNDRQMDALFVAAVAVEGLR